MSRTFAATFNFWRSPDLFDITNFLLWRQKVHFAPDLRWKERRECQNYSEILTKLQSNENQAAQNHDTPQLSLLKISYQ